MFNRPSGPSQGAAVATPPALPPASGGSGGGVAPPSPPPASTPTAVLAYVEVRDGNTVRRVPLAGTRLVVGRAPDTQIHLDNASVSRQHAELYRDPFGRWWVRDMKSRNGTLINGQRVTEQVLAAGDVVQVGACSLTVPLPTTDSSRGPCGPASSHGTGVLMTEAETGTISTLKELEPPRIAASHLTTLSVLSEQLLGTADPARRSEAMCKLMVGEEFHATSAVVVRLLKADPDSPPELLCEPVHNAAGYRNMIQGGPQAPYLSRSLLKAVRATGEPAMASNLYNSPGLGNLGTAAVEMSISPSIMAAAAVACPVHNDDAQLDVLYAVLPPQYGTGEWLALASLAARHYQHAEQAWRARAAAEAHVALERELQRARQIQMRLVPREPCVAGLDLAVGFTPCRWVGGDYVDVVPMKDGRTLLTVADVCGKGLAAALVSSSLHTMVHGGIAAGLDLLGLMRTLNAYLSTTLPGESFVTMVAVAIDPAAGVVECVNAGHPPPLVVNPGQAPRELHSGENLPLACDPTEEMQSHTYELAPGGLLALYTDGLTEQTDAAGELLGMNGLTAWIGDICAARATTAAAAADALTQRSEALRGSRPPDDDRTFLLARRV